MPKLTVKTAGVPIGSYTCKFVGTESVDHAEYGDGLKWIFQVVEGSLSGKETYRTTKPDPTPKNSCGKFLAALAGEAPSDGLDVDTDDYIGRRYMVMVGASQGGDSTRIETFVPEKDES